nr:LLM class flavin-dependent oxidoreductase [Dactylosporangium thailandense]
MTSADNEQLRARLAQLTPQQRLELQRRLRETRPAGASTPAPAPTPAPSPRGDGSRAPRFSLFFFSSDAQHPAAATYDLVRRCAAFADEHGFHAVWMPERHYDPFGGPYPDPAVLAAAIAATTRRLRIRAGSVVLPLHDPLQVAERWAMVDNLSGGRVDISLASGWHPQDFVVSPGTFEPRKQVLAERLTQLRTLWAGGTLERTDGAGTTVSVAAYPRPVQTSLDVWLTSSSNPATWRTAARMGTNVLTALLEQSVEELAEKAAVYREAREAEGLAPDAGEITVMLHTLVGTDVDAVRRLAREPLQRYLRSHVDLFEKLVRSRGLDINLDQVTEQDKQTLVEMAFERYFTTNGLFGTPETALERVRALVAAGATEIACLVDFGVGHDAVVEHLVHLRRLADLATAEFDAGLEAAQPATVPAAV